MNVIIVYATNSSGTYQAASLIREILESNDHAVKFQHARDTAPKDLSGYDLIILGSCTWERLEQGHRLEGQLQQHMHELASQLHSHPLPGQAFAVFALGDQSYTDFCQAADRLEDVVADVGGTKVAETLRVDRWFFNLERNRLQVREWAKGLGLGQAKSRERKKWRQ